MTNMRYEYHQISASTTLYWPSTIIYQCPSMSLATHSGQLFQVTIVPLDNCSSQNLFLRSFTNGHLQRGRSLEWTIEYLPQLLQSLISLTDDNRKNKDQNSNKRFALFTLSSLDSYHNLAFFIQKVFEGLKIV